MPIPEKTTASFFIIAGEASGDLLGSRLMKAIKAKTGEQTRFFGIGGPHMMAEGLDLLFPHTELMHFGVVEVLRHIPRLLGRINQAATAVIEREPDALITIDSPDFCFRVAEKVKNNAPTDIPLIHYVAPTVWAWRPGRAKKIARFLDCLLAVLPFEPPYFIKEGLPCEFVGHSVVEGGADKGNSAKYRAKHNVPEDAVLLTVLFGSRNSEFSSLAPVFRTAVGILARRFPKLHIAAPTVPHLQEKVTAEVKSWGVPSYVTTDEQDKYDAFAASKAAMACSGTVALELALALLPSVIAYKVNSLTAFVYRRFIRTPYVNLVNIMHGKKVVPELLQENCNPEKLAQATEVLLCNDEARQEQISRLAATAQWLGQGIFVPSEKAAEAVLKASGITKQPPTVMQVLPALVTGGVERGTVETTAALVQNGYRAIVASSGGPMANEVEKAGGIHITLPLASKNPFIIWKNISRLQNIIKAYGIDIVHARSRAPAWSAYFAAEKSGAHFVTTFHSAYGAASKIKRLYNSVMAKGEKVIAISEFVADYAENTYEVPREIMRVIPRGADVEKFDATKVSPSSVQALRQEWKLTDQDRVILMPGRITKWKGHKVLIQAIAMLKRNDFKCIMVGGGNDEKYKTELLEQIKTSGLENRAFIMETCRDMPAAYMLADIVVVPSTRPEGFGRVVIEAQAMGKPVIASDHGGAMETVIQGKTGWLTPPEDAEALSKTIQEVLDAPEIQIKQIAEQASSHIRANFTTTSMTGKTLETYREFLE